MAKKGVKVCIYCDQDIDLDDEKYILLGTYNGKKVLEEGYYHFQCFKDWYNSKVTEKTTNTLKTASGIVGNMLRSLKKRMGGGEGIIDIVQDEIPDIEKELET